MTELVAIGLVTAGLMFAVGRWWGMRARRPKDKEQLVSLQDLALTISESLEIDRIARQVAEYLIGVLDADGVLIVLTGDDGAEVHVAAATGSLSAAEGKSFADAGDGVIAKALESETLQAIPGSSAPKSLLPGLRFDGGAVAPLRAHGETVGAVAVATPADAHLTWVHQRVLLTVCTHAALVLANARLLELVKQGKQQWETVFDAFGDGITVIDGELRVQRANRALAQALDRPLKSVVGQQLPALFEESADDVASYLADVQARERAPLTVRSQSLDRVYRVTARPVHGPRFGSGWTLALVRDVTKQEAMEAQLLDAERMAAVGHLISGVAHELNNPLTSIAGLSEFLVARGTLEGPEAEHLEVIREQADRAGRIVRGLLTLARPEQGQVTCFEFNELARQASGFIQHELEGAELQCRLASESLPVRGDPHQLQQVVMNLVTNAVHAVRENESGRTRRVTLATERAGDRVSLRVTDTGPGIPDDVRPNIFTPFFTTKHPGLGTGLGLPIAYRIVRGHRGVLTVETTGPEGTTFLLELPLADSPAGPEPKAPSGSPQSERVHEGPTGRKILLVDEDPAIRRTVGALFANDGQSVETAPDAAGALRMLAEHEYDLVIGDPRASVSGGATFADQLIELCPAMRSRTLLITADVRPETAAWLEGLGYRFFRKPFGVREFQAAAWEILRTPTQS